MDVEIANVTGALAAVNLAGPQARELLAGLTDADVSAEALPYLDAREAQVAGVPCLLLRIGFVGELGYELHFPSPYGEHLWDTLLERGRATPFGLEAQRILRLEKQHIIVGQDTDSESNVLDANMPWLVEARQGRLRRQVGARARAGARAARAARRLRDGERRAAGRGRAGRARRPAGRPRDERAPQRGSSARRSASRGCRPSWPRRTRASRSASHGRLEPARVRLRPFFDPEGERLRS